MDEENPTSPNVPETDNSAAVEQQPVKPDPEETQQPVESEKEDVESGGTNELPETEPPLVELPKEDPFLNLIPENPQLYSTNYVTEDYVITLIHDLTLGDMLIATLLSVLIVVVVLKAVLGGDRVW